MAIQSITIDRFKRIDHVEFNLSGVNILVGANNSGKSTIIQAVHFAFTLFQSLSYAKKWPAKTKKSSTVSPSELIYIPSDDPYSLGFGGRLVEDEEKAIIVGFIFDDGAAIKVAVRKGRITNILVEPDNIELGQQLSSLNSPYSVFSPGLAGVSRNENYVSDGVLLRVLARGDANIVLRNILYRLKQKPEWNNFENDLTQIFSNVRIDVKFDTSLDQYININILEDNKDVPLDLAGTGLLQAVQILAYLHLFSPKLIILDEPDSHLHPNNQRLLCSLLSTISLERRIQVVFTTHSRHVLDAMSNDAKILWVQDALVTEAVADDQIGMLLELGALDIKEKISSGVYKVIFLTEDRLTQYIAIILKNSGFVMEETAVLPYNGVTSLNLLKALIMQIKKSSNAAIFVHRDRDYLDLDEIEQWKVDIRAAGAEPFVTSEMDIEGYFCTDEYIRDVIKKFGNFDIQEMNEYIMDGEVEAIHIAYVNGRIDVERKKGNVGKIDIGRLSVSASSTVAADPSRYLKGKKKLAKLKHVMQTKYGVRFEVDSNAAIPVDNALAQTAAKYFKRKS